MIGTAIVCSGQGGQASTMFDLLGGAPAASPVFEAAKSVLGGIDPRDLVRQQSSAAIHADKTGQVLCCTQAMAAWAVIGDKLPRPLLVAGYSIGEVAAWGVAGLLDATGVLELASRRAAAMDAATLQPSGLASIRGLYRDVLEPVCQAHRCAIAIVNGPDQMLAGGTLADLAAVMRDAMRAGAQHAAILPVAVASHTPLLAAARAAFRQDLAKAPIPARVPEGIRLLSGIDGMAVFDVEDGEEKLARQIAQTVDWAACMDSIRACGVNKVIELGPGAALARMLRTELPHGDVHGLAEFHTLSGFTGWACGEA